MRNPIKTLPPNHEGRDFVVGDIHGSLSVLVNLLAGVRFDPTKDRLASVADLVDRGPDSLRCLQLLNESWFHCVLANHEQMMLEAFNGGYMGQFWIQNGGAWGIQAYKDWQHRTSFITDESKRPAIEADSKALFELFPLVEELPLLITIERPDGKKFHVIHAEFPPGHEVTDEILADPEKVLALNRVQTQDGDHIVWGRYLFRNFYKADLSNVEKVRRTVYYGGTPKLFNDKLSHILSGHTIVQRPLTICGQTNLDTCAYGSYHSHAAAWERMTCVELGSWKFYQATETEFWEVEPLVIDTPPAPKKPGATSFDEVD
jgi:serine/threonine protein phosphatase 1